MTCAVPVVWRFNLSFGLVRRVCPPAKNIYFIIIPMHVMIREAIPGR